MMKHENPHIEVLNKNLWAVRFSLLPYIPQISYKPDPSIPLEQVPGQFGPDGIMVLNKDFKHFELVKKAAVEAVEAGKPVNLLFGTVISASPLKIQVDQKAIYTEKMLVLTRNVTDYEVDITVSQQGRKKLTVHNALVVGDWVLLARIQRGKKFVVLDRIKPHPALKGEWV